MHLFIESCTIKVSLPFQIIHFNEMTNTFQNAITFNDFLLAYIFYQNFQLYTTKLY